MKQLRQQNMLYKRCTQFKKQLLIQRINQTENTMVIGTVLWVEISDPMQLISRNTIYISILVNMDFSFLKLLKVDDNFQNKRDKEKSIQFYKCLNQVLIYRKLQLFIIQILTMSQYGKPQYWEQRYNRDSQPFDWYQRYNGLKDIISTNISTDKRILNVGAGNSRLSEEMVDEGFTNITNIDISPICTKMMVEKYKQKSEKLKYLQMDVKAMDFPEGSFDAVIDKATLDSILCGQNSTLNAAKMISQIYRVLTSNGVYVIISYGQPEYRLSYLQRPEFEWTVKVQQIPKPTIASSVSIVSDEKQTPNVHYIYICKRGKPQ